MSPAPGRRGLVTARADPAEAGCVARDGGGVVGKRSVH